MALITFTVMHNNHLHPIPKQVHHPKQNCTMRSLSPFPLPLAPGSYQSTFCLPGFTYAGSLMQI